MPHDGWREGYDALLTDAAAALEGVPTPDLTVELIAHRFTPGSKDVLLGWYPGTSLEMDEAKRARKTTRFGSTKFVYLAATMRELRDHLERACAARLPGARVLYWT
jgi:spore photoproduct lyase